MLRASQLENVSSSSLLLRSPSAACHLRRLPPEDSDEFRAPRTRKLTTIKVRSSGGGPALANARDPAHDPLAQFLRRCPRCVRNHFLEAIFSELFLIRVRRLIDTIGVKDERIGASILTDPAE